MKIFSKNTWDIDVNNAWPLTCKASCLKKIELRPLISGFDFALLEVRNLCVASRLSVTYYLLKKCDWNDDMIASNCTKKTTEMLYLLPTLPSIRFTLRNTTAPVLIKLNGPFHFYRE